MRVIRFIFVFIFVFLFACAVVFADFRSVDDLRSVSAWSSCGGESYSISRSTFDHTGNGSGSLMLTTGDWSASGCIGRVFSASDSGLKGMIWYYADGVSSVYRVEFLDVNGSGLFTMSGSELRVWRSLDVDLDFSAVEVRIYFYLSKTVSRPAVLYFDDLGFDVPDPPSLVPYLDLSHAHSMTMNFFSSMLRTPLVYFSLSALVGAFIVYVIVYKPIFSVWGFDSRLWGDDGFVFKTGYVAGYAEGEQDRSLGGFQSEVYGGEGFSDGFQSGYRDGVQGKSARYMDV